MNERTITKRGTPYAVEFQRIGGAWERIAQFALAADAASFITFVGLKYRGETRGAAWRVWDIRKRRACLNFPPEVDSNG